MNLKVVIAKSFKFVVDMMETILNLTKIKWTLLQNILARKFVMQIFARRVLYYNVVYCITMSCIMQEVWPSSHGAVFWCRILLYFICCFTALVPQQLIEFRYYIIPYLIFRIYIPKPHDWRLFLSLCSELLLYTSINTVTIYLFLYRPFRWDNTPGQMQRFMW